VPLTRKIHANARRIADQFFHQHGGMVVPDQGNGLSGRKRKQLVLALRSSGSFEWPLNNGVLDIEQLRRPRFVPPILSALR
jgi:hypothetical protein